MKKTIFNLLVILAVAAGTVFASTEIPNTGTSIGSQAFKMSNKVHILVSSLSSVDPNNPGGFASCSWHETGNRFFSVNSVEPKIYWKDKATGDTTPTVSFTTPTSYEPAIATGWNSL